MAEKIQAQLVKLLGAKESPNFMPILTTKDISSSLYHDEVQKIYKALGGILLNYPVNPKNTWDLCYQNTIIELDEQLHFNRYRQSTLSSAIYKSLPNFPLHDYQQYCRHYEADCLGAGGYGGKWTNESCERQFGVGSPPKILTGNGAPRWKQRAFYDFIKDMTPLILGFNVVRLTIAEAITVGQTKMTIEQAIKEPSTASRSAIINLLVRRCHTNIPL